MAAWTLLEAEDHLKTWLEAEKAVATGQSYQIGPRKLERVNIMQIREQIKFWKKEVDRLSGKSSRRVTRVIPRDL
jgi:hypothetical protein